MAQRSHSVSRPMIPTTDGSGRLAENVMHFARVLRGAGIPVGPDRVIDALKALEVAGVARRDQPAVGGTLLVSVCSGVAMSFLPAAGIGAGAQA